MSTPHASHHAPTNFWCKYVFSTDHKVIGLQFTFASMFFVVIGGLLAMAVRYQLAWPNQNVPYAFLLPGKEGTPVKMTTRAPEANPGLWHAGGTIELRHDLTINDHKIPAGALGQFTGFVDNALPVVLPVGTRIQSADGESRTLDQRTNAQVSASAVMGDYDYSKQQVRAVAGIPVVLSDQPPQTVTLLGSEYYEPDPDTGQAKSTPTFTTDPLLLDVRSATTKINVTFPAAITDKDGKELAHFTSPTAAAVLPAPDVSYIKQTLTPDAYLTLFTMHATIMVFFVLMPMLLGGFGNFLIPLLIGARDMAFPKLNMLSFWLAIPSGLLIMLSFWVPGGAAGGGWTMYPPHSEIAYSTGWGIDLWLLAITLVGFSTIVGTLNYITTILNMRAPGMTMFRLPLTVWSLFVTSILALLATPVLAAAGILLLLDRRLGAHFFTPMQGGQPLMWQHLFWFFGHPEVYILILPAMGITSDILATFSRKPIFGYKPMVFAMAAIGVLGFVVWGHHMFQAGMNPLLGTTFMAATIMIAVPSAIKTFNWLGTIWGGDISFTPAMLFALGFVSMFVIGGLSGIFMASAPVDVHIHDTYFIVAHIHYVFFGGTIMGIFAGIYYWFPKMFGRQLNQRWGVVHFWMTIIAINGTFFLMHILGIGGAPRRYFSHLEYPTLVHLQPLNVVMTVFALMLGAAQLPFLYNFFVCLPRKLGRAIVAVYAAGLGLPLVIGLTFWTSDGTSVQALTKGAALGTAYVLAVVLAVFTIWWLGGLLHITALLHRLLYLVALPAYLAPLILKKDPYLWANVPTLYDHHWLILALTAVPGLLYLLAFRPRDQFAYAPDDNPWKANTLEWQTSSPPPFENFPVIPRVRRGPYEFSSPVTEKDYLPQPLELPPGVVESLGH